MKDEPEEKPDIHSQPKRTRREAQSNVTPALLPSAGQEAKREPDVKPEVGGSRPTRRSMRGQSTPSAPEPCNITSNVKKISAKTPKRISKASEMKQSNEVEKINPAQQPSTSRITDIELAPEKGNSVEKVNLDPVPLMITESEKVESTKNNLSAYERLLKIEEEEKEVERRALELQRIRDEFNAKKEKVRLELEEERRKKAEEERIKLEKEEKEKIEKEKFDQMFQSLSARDKDIIEGLKVRML